jgi:hypothetical protein
VGPSLSSACQSALATANKDAASVNRALGNESTLQAAVQGTNIPWEMLAAIGVRETGFINMQQTCTSGVTWGSPGCQGDGVFQLTVSASSGVTATQAESLTTAANIAAQMLNSNMATLAANFPNLTPTQLLQATAASYNFGTGNISGNPSTIDVGTTGNNYGSNVLGLMNCFP